MPRVQRRQWAGTRELNHGRAAPDTIAVIRAASEVCFAASARAT